MPATLRRLDARKTERQESPALESERDVASLLEGIAEGEVLHLAKGKTVFTQGSPADAIYFVQEGKIKVTVVSVDGKEAVLSLLGSRDFLGEECLVGDSPRNSTAVALEPSKLLRVRKPAMLRALQTHPELSQKFVASLFIRRIGLEEDLCDQLFNPCEKRLAWTLLKLARVRQRHSSPAGQIPRISHEILAEMVGTTRSRISQFMNKFRTLHLIDYDHSGDIKVNEDRLTDLVLHGRAKYRHRGVHRQLVDLYGRIQND